MSFAITGSGGGNISASDARSLRLPAGGGGGSQASASYFVTGLAAGTKTFTTYIKHAGNTVTFSNRQITVIPF